MIFYTDKPEIFECQLNIEGASIEDAAVSLVLEAKKWNLVFYGDVDENGKCRISIPKLDVLKEGDSGRVILKVLAEDTQFIPFNDNFEIKTNKKVTVESISLLNLPKDKVQESTKPKVQIENIVLKNSEPIKKTITTPTVNKTQSDSKSAFVSTIKQPTTPMSVKEMCISEIKQLCETNNISSLNFNNKNTLFKKIIIETVKKHKFDYKKNSTWIMDSMLDFFVKR